MPQGRYGKRWGLTHAHRGNARALVPSPIAATAWHTGTNEPQSPSAPYDGTTASIPVYLAGPPTDPTLSTVPSVSAHLQALKDQWATTAQPVESPPAATSIRPSRFRGSGSAATLHAQHILGADATRTFTDEERATVYANWSRGWRTRTAAIPAWIRPMIQECLIWERPPRNPDNDGRGPQLWILRRHDAIGKLHEVVVTSIRNSSRLTR